MRQKIVGVMGPGEQATARSQQLAYSLGELIAQRGWILLTGGRSVGVMDAASRGAKQAGGLTLGILPTADRTGASESVDIVIPTGIGNARNVINVLTCDAIIACGMGSGTASEIALALKLNRLTVLLDCSPSGQLFFQELVQGQVQELLGDHGLLHMATTPEQAVQQVEQFFERDCLQEPF